MTAAVSKSAMRQLFKLSSSVGRDPAVEAWMQGHAGALGGSAYADMKRRLEAE